jgi:Spy/CpxP family protein refolding chaperone
MGGPQFPGGGPSPGNSAPGNYNPGIAQPSQRSQSAEGRAGLRFGPPGVRWWDDHGFAKNLKLRPDQQQRMDTIFEQNRNALVTSYEGVRQAAAQMQELSKSPSPDEAALAAQIDRFYQAQAELDKAYTHLLLQIRKEMDADQIKRLEKASQP